MTLIVDAAPLIALGARSDPDHLSVQALFETEPGPLILSPYVAAEVDYMLGRKFGWVAQEAFLRDLAGGLYELQVPSSAEHGIMQQLMHQYRDLNPGLADLSVVVLADRNKTNRIATFDQRHFRVLRPLSGGSFTLLPVDGER